MISGKEEASDFGMQTSNCSCSKSFDRNSTKFCLWIQSCMLMKLWHDLAPGWKRNSQTAIKALRFCIKISSFKTSMLQFLRKTKFSNLPLEFCKFMQRLWSTNRNTIFSQLPIDILSGRTSFEGVWGSPLNLHRTTADCSQPCFSKMVAEDHRSDQHSSI